MKTKLIIGLILLIILISGCSQISPQNLETITLQECQSQGGQTVSITLNTQENNSAQKCPENHEFAGIIEFSEKPLICCIPNEPLPPPNFPEPQDQCNSNSDCNDNNACTTDTCTSETPTQCLHSQITACVLNDGCCPASCNWESDGDCELDDLCQNDSDCDDGNSATKDTCTGNPKTCTHNLKTCSEMGGNFCTGFQYCSQAFVTSSDSSTCCPTTCADIEQDPCGGICASNYECVDGTCVPKSCDEQGGTACPLSTDTCDGLMYYYPDESLECCVGTCTPRPTCDSLGGTFCSETLCEGNSQNTYDSPGNDVCCTGTCHIGFCGVATSQTTAEQYLDALINDNYNQFVSVTNHDCSANPSSCQSVFESDQAKAQAYDSIEFDTVTEGTEGFTSVYFDLTSTGQPAVTFQTRQNYILGGCRIVSKIWYT